MKKNFLFVLTFISLLLILVGCEDDVKGPVVDNENYGFESASIADVFVNTCASSGCHNGPNPAGGLSTENYSKLLSGSVNRDPAKANGFGGEVVIPFNSEKSLLYQLLKGNVTPVEPHQNINISQERITEIKDWIDNGARHYYGNVPSANPSYRVFVCNQASDIISVIDGDNKIVSRIANVDFNPTIDAPHMVKEFDEFYYVTLISANKFLKIRKSDNQIVGETNGIDKAGMIQISPDGTKAFVSRSSTSAGIYNSVFAISLSDMSIITEISMPVTGVPHALAITPDGKKLYVANLTKDRISIINTETYEFVDDIILDQGTEPMEATISPDGNYLYVSGMGNNKLIVIDTQTEQVVTSVDVNHMPMHIAVSSNGAKIYVATMMMSTVDVIEKSGNNWIRTGRISHPGFNMLHGCDLSPDDKYLYVSSRNLNGNYQPKFKINGEGNNGTLGIINTATLQVEKILDLKEFPSGLVVEALHQN
ncbi:MAG TPA: YncE family protein [Ignavibacteriaceae bacterium]|nr:YncE family protein [Ignavibacteriaceae bacterium]